MVVNMSDTTVQIAAAGTTNWVTLGTYPDYGTARDQMTRIHRDSMILLSTDADGTQNVTGTLNARILDEGDPIPAETLTWDVQR